MNLKLGVSIILNFLSRTINTEGKNINFLKKLLVLYFFTANHTHILKIHEMMLILLLTLFLTSGMMMICRSPGFFKCELHSCQRKPQGSDNYSESNETANVCD